MYGCKVLSLARCWRQDVGGTYQGKREREEGMAQSILVRRLEALFRGGTTVGTRLPGLRLSHFWRVGVCLAALNLLIFPSTLESATAREAAASQPDSPRDFKSVEFSQFVGEVNRELLLPLNVTVPKRYEKVSFAEAQEGYSFWMPPEEAEGVASTGDLPGNTGYFYTKVSLEVGYDRDQDLFLGFEDRDAGAEARSMGIEDLEWHRGEFGGYPALVTQFTNPITGGVHYGVYIATLYEGIVFYVVYVPPADESSVGTTTWDHFISTVQPLE